MKKLIVLIFAIVLITSCTTVKKVNVDYAHEFDFTPVKTFQYFDSTDSNSKNPLMAQRIANQFKKELREGGLTEVSENPDIFVTYHITSKENTSYNTTYTGYGGYGGYGPGWGGWGGGYYGGYGSTMGSSMTYATTYTEGTLVLDAYEPETKNLVWRGTGTVTVSDKPEKQLKQVDAIFTKIGSRWDKILKGQGK